MYSEDYVLLYNLGQNDGTVAPAEAKRNGTTRMIAHDMQKKEIVRWTESKWGVGENDGATRVCDGEPEQRQW